MNEAAGKGYAIAGFTVAGAILARLQRKGLLTKQEVQDLLDGVLTSLEELTPEPNAPETLVARELVDFLAKVAATDGTLKPKELR